MKKFFFSLQFLLDYRKRREESLKKELAKMIAKEEKEKEVLEKLQEKLLFWQKQLEEKKKEERISIPMMLVYYSYLEEFLIQIKKQVEKIENISLEKERLQKKLLQATKDRKIVEEIKEKRWEEFILQQKKLEQKFIDENALIKFYQKKEINF